MGNTRKPPPAPWLTSINSQPEPQISETRASARAGASSAQAFHSPGDGCGTWQLPTPSPRHSASSVNRTDTACRREAGPAAAAAELSATWRWAEAIATPPRPGSPPCHTHPDHPPPPPRYGRSNPRAVEPPATGPPAGPPSDPDHKIRNCSVVQPVPGQPSARVDHQGKGPVMSCHGAKIRSRGKRGEKADMSGLMQMSVVRGILGA